MRRFIFPPEARDGDTVILAGDLFRHVVKVLRLRRGAEILLVDGEGREFAGRIGEIGKCSAVVLVEPVEPAVIEAVSPRITIYQGLPKGGKIDLILQKGTELGAAAIIPFAAERSVCRLTPAQQEERVGRWRRIVMEAARQSGRRQAPAVSFAASITEAAAGGEEVKLLLWEDEQGTRLKDILPKVALPASVAVLVGPEGGFSAAEVAEAVKRDYRPVSLGSRILRTESAPLAILAILQYVWGDIG